MCYEGAKALVYFLLYHKSSEFLVKEHSTVFVPFWFEEDDNDSDDCCAVDIKGVDL